MGKQKFSTVVAQKPDTAKALNTAIGAPVNVKHFGAVGDGVTDDTAAIQAAASSLIDGGILNFPNGTYIVSGQINCNSNTFLSGYSATIKASSVRFLGAFFAFTSKTNITIKGFTFDMNGDNLPVYQAEDYPNSYNGSIALNGCSNILIKDCKFKNLYNNSIEAINCSNLFSILNNFFNSTTQAQATKAGHIYIVTFGGNLLIKDNEIANDVQSNPSYGVGGVFLSGQVGSAIIKDNRFNYCGRNNTGGHREAVIDLYGNTQNVIVSGNTSNNTTGQFLRANGSKNLIVTKNQANVVLMPDSAVILIACQSSYVTGNIKIYSNKITSSIDNLYGLIVQMDDWGLPHDNSCVDDNIFIGCKFPITVNGVQKNLSICRNILEDGDFSVAIGIKLTSMVTATEIIGTQANSQFGLINICGNNIKSNSGGIDINNSGYTGQDVGIVKISSNMIIMTALAQGIATNTITPYVSENIIHDANIGLYLRNKAVAYAYDNVMVNAATPINATSITTLHSNNNLPV